MAQRPSNPTDTRQLIPACHRHRSRHRRGARGKADRRLRRHTPHTDEAVRVSGEQRLAIRRPRQREDVRDLASRGRRLGLELVNHRLGLEVPDLDDRASRRAQPVPAGAVGDTGRVSGRSDWVGVGVRKRDCGAARRRMRMDPRGEVQRTHRLGEKVSASMIPPASRV